MGSGQSRQSGKPKRIKPPKIVTETTGFTKSESESCNVKSPEKKQSSIDFDGDAQQLRTMADVVEQTLCKEDELNNGETREYKVEGATILLVKENGKFFAIGGKCTHYGAQLSKGAYSNGFVRCPWHGACFNVETGDIEDFPGLDSVQTYKIQCDSGNVKLVASKEQLASVKRQNVCPYTITSCNPNDNVVIVGGGGAGGSCAEFLRSYKYNGRVIMITQEAHLPYDRPKLSKTLDASAESMQLRSADFYRDNHIDVQFNRRAVGVDFAKKTLRLDDGTDVPYKYLVIATGGKPRHLTCPGSDLSNVFYLRSPNDGAAIAQAVPGKNVVVIGSSFIGMELASWAVGKQPASVSVVSTSQLPYQQLLGAEVGKSVQNLFESRGVKFHMNSVLKEFTGEGGKVTQVVLQDGTKLPADVLIVGIGVVPSVDFLTGTNINRNQRGHVVVDEFMQSSVPGVFACGDIAAFPLSLFDNQVDNVQHWQMALKHGKVAAASIAGQPRAIKTVPFFWTAFFGKSIRFTGYCPKSDQLIIHGNVDELKFVIYYVISNKVVAVATSQRDPIAAQIGECFRNNIVITVDDVKKNESDDWTYLLQRR